MSDSSKKPGGECKSVQALMQNQNPGLGQILAHARVLNHLDQILASILDPNLSCHCQVAEFRDHCLILVCSNATFATRIRMISPQVLDSFREEGNFGIERIEIRIAPVNRPQPEVRKKRTLSPAAVQALGRFASDSGDAEIQAIFERIKARRNG
ncbi:MAG: DUF721 domain-containing protein [Lysobacterales bacterium]